jgi:hypothetical protein
LNIVRLLAFTFLIVPLELVPASAQNQLPNAMLREVNGEINSPPSYAPAMAKVVLPDAPAPQQVKLKVIDKKFIVMMAALGGAETLRFTTHKLVLDNEHAAGAPWVASVPPNQHLVAKYAGIYALELLVAYELKKPHSWLPGDRIMQKFWWAYPATMVPIHLKNGIRSIRTQAPAAADCPPEYQQYCGGQ